MHPICSVRSAGAATVVVEGPPIEPGRISYDPFVLFTAIGNPRCESARSRDAASSMRIDWKRSWHEVITTLILLKLSFELSFVAH